MRGASDLIVVDAAGAVMGGAAKYLGELQGYIRRGGRLDIRLTGESRRLTPAWLARREWSARGAMLRVALNNAGYVIGHGRNVTLLANALHFATSSELDNLGYVLPRALALQTKVVRAAARRSDILVVPCSSMAERVAHFEPSLADRLAVKLHPLTQADWAGDRQAGERVVLMPILNAPYKRLGVHLANLLAASSELLNAGTRICVTAHGSDFAESLRRDARFDFVGPQSGAKLDALWRKATAVYFPTEIESFGYPLAEARANGIPVIALRTDQNREIAGDALCGYVRDDPSSLQNAVLEAFTRRIAPDATAFDPDAYFNWMFGGAA